MHARGMSVAGGMFGRKHGLAALLMLLSFGWMITIPPADTWADDVVTISDSEPIVDFPANGQPTHLPAELPVALFDFSGQPTLQSIDNLTFSITIEDGDTGAGEFDHDQLTLKLDSVETGLPLNGFLAGQEYELTFLLRGGDFQFTDAAMQQLLNDYQQDQQILATIVDGTPGDNFVQLYSFFDTTLSLTGSTGPGSEEVPEPVSLMLWASGLGVAGLIRKRRAKASATV